MSSVGYHENLRRQKYDEFCKLVEQRGGKVQSPLEKYQNRNSKLQVQCSGTHIFEIDFAHLSRRHQWCAKCRIHFCEGIAVAAMSHFLERPFEKIKPDWLRYPKTNSLLEIDGYNDELKLGVEMNGIQHSEFVPFFHRTPTALEELQDRDRWKNQKCRELGVTLLTVPHTVKPKDIPQFLAERLNEIGYFVEPERTESFNFSQLRQPQSLQNKLVKIASEKKGEILTPLSKIINEESPIQLKCQEGHIWTTKAYCISYAKHWCSRCARKWSDERKIECSEKQTNFYQTEEGKKQLVENGQKIRAYYLTEKGLEHKKKTTELIKQRAAAQAALRKPITEKTCYTCKRTLDVTYFSKDSQRICGYRSNCRECIKSRTQQLRQKRDLVQRDLDSIL